MPSHPECRETIAQRSNPLAPQPTGAEPRLPRLDDTRAVVFDIYGTLLISGSGDISLTSGAAKGSAATEALQAVGVDGAAGEAILETLHEQIHASHAATRESAGVEFPEVDIVDIWRKTLASRDLKLADGELPRLATEYECRVNPVWPMPGLVDVLAAIKRAGLPMGIVSNAQFFTPLAMEQLTGQTLGELGFVEDLCVWSFAHLRAKPGAELYAMAAERLAGHGIQPGETLYVGNDMRNDIAPAAGLGFRTALFAGDARSLRLREGDPMVAGVAADAVVTELPQLLRILSLAAH
ncbi:MAG: HAD family hydrolase [Planctomycetota bacterium]